MGELDRVLERKRKLQAQLEGTRARGPARGRRRKQAEEGLEKIEYFLTGLESGLMSRDQKKRARARERRRRSVERLEAARSAMTQRKDVQAEWVITTFRDLVDGLKAETISPAPRAAPATNNLFESRPAGRYFNFTTAGLCEARRNAGRSARLV